MIHSFPPPRYEAIIPGNTDLLVEYRQNLYCFVDEGKLQKFLRHPERYYNLKLPHKLPPKKDPLLVTSLPMLGYMEQALSVSITKALTSVGCFKPKFPFLSASRSAVIYLAYHLKCKLLIKFSLIMVQWFMVQHWVKCH